MAPTREGQLDNLGQQIADGIAQGLQHVAPKQIKIGQYDPKSSFHPNKKLASKLRGKAYQNGIELHPEQLFDKEIDLLNAIHTSGRYIDELVTVVLRDDAGIRKVDIRYPCETPDQRMELMRYFRNLQELLQIIADAQGLIAPAA